MDDYEDCDLACLKKFGYISNSDNDSDFDSKPEFDNEFEAFKPAPLQINPNVHKIIEIKDSSNALAPIPTTVKNTQGVILPKVKKSKSRKKAKPQQNVDTKQNGDEQLTKADSLKSTEIPNKCISPEKVIEAHLVTINGFYKELLEKLSTQQRKKVNNFIRINEMIIQRQDNIPPFQTFLESMSKLDEAEFTKDAITIQQNDCGHLLKIKESDNEVPMKSSTSKETTEVHLAPITIENKEPVGKLSKGQKKKLNKVIQINEMIIQWQQNIPPFTFVEIISKLEEVKLTKDSITIQQNDCGHSLKIEGDENEVPKISSSSEETSQVHLAPINDETEEYVEKLSKKAKKKLNRTNQIKEMAIKQQQNIPPLTFVESMSKREEAEFTKDPITIQENDCGHLLKIKENENEVPMKSSTSKETTQVYLAPISEENEEQVEKLSKGQMKKLKKGNPINEMAIKQQQNTPLLIFCESKSINEGGKSDVISPAVEENFKKHLLYISGMLTKILTSKELNYIQQHKNLFYGEVIFSIRYLEHLVELAIETCQFLNMEQINHMKTVTIIVKDITEYMGKPFSNVTDQIWFTKKSILLDYFLKHVEFIVCCSCTQINGLKFSYANQIMDSNKFLQFYVHIDYELLKFIELAMLSFIDCKKISVLTDNPLQFQTPLQMMKLFVKNRRRYSLGIYWSNFADFVAQFDSFKTVWEISYLKQFPWNISQINLPGHSSINPDVRIETKQYFSNFNYSSQTFESWNSVSNDYLNAASSSYKITNQPCPTIEGQTKKFRMKKKKANSGVSAYNQLIIEDLTENKKYFYNHNYSKKSFNKWQQFLGGYLNGGGSDQSQLYPAITEDLSRERSHFYRTSYSKEAFNDWRNFQLFHLNENWTNNDFSNFIFAIWTFISNYHLGPWNILHYIFFYFIFKIIVLFILYLIGNFIDLFIFIFVLIYLCIEFINNS